MRPIDADAFSARMYHEVFEKDNEDQRWDSGCWIRYRLFEKVLKEAPTIEPEQKTEKLIEEINKMDRLYLNIQDGEIRVLPYDNVIRIIQRTEPERKTGKWTDDGFCPFCGYIQQWEDDNYCGNCGAYLRGE